MSHFGISSKHYSLTTLQKRNKQLNSFYLTGHAFVQIDKLELHYTTL